jgi:hypothetical protein
MRKMSLIVVHPYQRDKVHGDWDHQVLYGLRGTDE